VVLATENRHKSFSTEANNEMDLVHLSDNRDEPGNKVLRSLIYMAFLDESVPCDAIAD
jgi:hypothetical protein